MDQGGWNDEDAGGSQPDDDPADADAGMRAALAERAIMKKPAAARRRRSAAADARGACVKGTCTEKTISFLAHDKHRTKHQFCSAWYHRKRNQLQKEGRSKEQIAQQMKKLNVYAAAGKVWDEHMES